MRGRPGRDPVAERDEARRRSARAGPGWRARWAPRTRMIRRRVGAADAARARADEHERGAGHDERASEQHPPPVVDERGEREGDEHGGGRLGDDAHEVEGVDVRADVGGDREQRSRERGDASARSTRSVRLSTVSAESAAASRPPKATSSDGDADEEPDSIGQRRRSASEKPTRMSRWMPNISFSSSGSA